MKEGCTATCQRPYRLPLLHTGSDSKLHGAKTLVNNSVSNILCFNARVTETHAQHHDLCLCACHIAPALPCMLTSEEIVARRQGARTWMLRAGRTTLPYCMSWGTTERTMSMGMANPTPAEVPVLVKIAVFTPIT